MTSNIDFLHNAFRANGFDPDERLTPLAYIGAADTLARACYELEKAMLQARADRDDNEQAILRLQTENASLKKELTEARESHNRSVELAVQAEAEYRQNLAAHNCY